jgi:hypothetical protein
MEDWEWDHLHDLIRREEDSEELQSFREVVTSSHVGDLVNLYWSSKTWRQKCLVIQVLQDQRATALEPILRDVLRAPDEPGDLVRATQAIALCHLEGDFSPERFTALFDEPELARVAARKWLPET